MTTPSSGRDRNSNCPSRVAESSWFESYEGARLVRHRPRFLSPHLLLIMMLMTNDPKIMGGQVNSGLQT
jgi:hypothetical protein